MNCLGSKSFLHLKELGIELESQWMERESKCFAAMQSRSRPAVAQPFPD